MATEYYSCKKLLTLKDKNRQVPDIFISDGNRTAGKSVAWKTHLMNRYFNADSDINQFLLLYRNKYELSGCDDKFFGDIERIFYQGHTMTSKKIGEGIAVVLYMDGEPCGFATCLSMASKLKPMSGIFARVAHMLFDEYQDEDGKYLQDEVKKLMSIHTSIARGDGKQTRRVPLYMASNTVSVLNPYYDALGINKQLKSDTKILRGDGWVYERTFNENAKNAFQAQAFNRAFQHSDYYKYASENVYLNDNNALIEQPSGNSQYYLTIKYNGEWFNFRKYDNVMYADEGADHGYPRRICFNVNDVTDDRVVMVGRFDGNVMILREWFQTGRMRFRNLKCKNMVYDLLAYI